MAENKTYRQVRFERPEGSTRILLVRHGESARVSAENPFPLLDGRGDPELSDLGHAQAKALAVRLGSTDPDAIYITQLRRTAQTASPLAKDTKLVPVVEPGLVEASMGEWEGGQYRQRMADRDPIVIQAFAEQRFDVIPGAESNDSVARRTTEALTKIAQIHRDGYVIVIAHAVSISSLLSQATGSTPFAFLGIDNGSISELIAGDGQWHLRRFNDVSHLDHLNYDDTNLD